MENVKLFGMPAEKGRWVLIPLGITLMLCLGTVYSWSIFRKPLEKALGINATESLLPFTVMLVVFAILMPMAGFYIEKYGTRRMITIGGVVTGLGYILSSFASNITLLVLTYGIIGGAGIGIAYGVPLAVAAKWFPDKKGLALGLTVTGFGLSPLVTAPIANSLIQTYQVPTTFAILGVAFIGISLAISTTLTLPPAGWKPSQWQPVAVSKAESQSQDIPLLKTQSFYVLWVCYTLGTFAGLSAIGISSSVAQEIIKLDSATAAITVSLFAVCNGVARPLFGWLTDRLKPTLAAVANYVLILIASILMTHAGEGDILTYLVAFSLFWLSLGGWLAIAPTATIALFKPENYTQNYGIVFTAYGVGALLGTLVAGRIRDLFGSYTFAFSITALLAVVGIFLAVFGLKKPGQLSNPSQILED